MKLPLHIAVCLLLLLSPVKAADQPKPKEPNPPAPTDKAETAPFDFNLQIQAAHDTYFGGEPIVLTVTLTNHSERKRDVGLFGTKAEWVVKGQDGQEISLTSHGSSKNVLRGLNSQSVEPEKSISYKVIINRLFDMTAAGTYEVTAQKWPMAEKPTTRDITAPRVTSNPIKISVTEEDTRVEKDKS